MPVNLAVYEFFLNGVASSIPSGLDLSTYLKACFFIYEQDADTGLIKIDDQSELISQYNPLTDLHEVHVIIRKEDCGTCDIVCYNGPFIPFGNLSFQLPEHGKYTIEIDIRYTVQYDDGLGNITPYIHQTVLIYPVEWVPSGAYHNNLIADIKCRISKLQCEIGKRMKVGRDRSEIQNRVFALNNYLYALCNFELCVEEVDAISCKVKTIKKTC